MATEMIFTWLRFLNEYLMKPSWFLFVAFLLSSRAAFNRFYSLKCIFNFFIRWVILCLQFLFDHKIVTWKADLGFKECNALNLCQTYFLHSQWKFIAIDQYEVCKHNLNASTKMSGFILVSESLLSLDLQGNLLILHHGYSYMQVT